MKRLNKLPSIMMFVLVTVMSFAFVYGKYVNYKTDNVLNYETSTYLQDVYILKEYNGRLAVFTSDEEKPIEVFDTAVEDLPEYDRKMIVEGITASTKEQLQRLIEDYTS